MIIKNTQLAVFGQIKFQAFIDTMVEFVLENFKIEDDPADLRSKVSLVIKEAQYYGFDEEDTIEKFIFLKWEYPEFRKEPLSDEILEILNYPDRKPIIMIEELILLFENYRNIIIE